MTDRRPPDGHPSQPSMFSVVVLIRPRLTPQDTRFRIIGYILCDKTAYELLRSIKADDVVV
jgi:hypothetical protein